MESLIPQTVQGQASPNPNDVDARKIAVAHDADTLQADNEDVDMLGRVDEELFCKAVDLVLLHGSATVSMLQRELKLNYAEAAFLIDVMEERCILGPFCGDRPRDVLISEAMWRGT